MSIRHDLHNITIVAHVDHGRTVPVDAMLWQLGAFREDTDVNERAMDSMDLERKKGITVLAKSTAVRHRMSDGRGMTVDIIDTPGRASLGGEVERGLEMVDDVALLVDASGGPLPQTRFVLHEALAKKLPLIVVVNKVDHSDTRISMVADEAYDLFVDLLDDDASDALDFPIVCAPAKTGRTSLSQPTNSEMPDPPNLEPLLETILKHVPIPSCEENAALQAYVANLGASPCLDRLTLCRAVTGELKCDQQVTWYHHDGSVQSMRLTELLITEALGRAPVESTGSGDIVAITGIPGTAIREALSDPDDPKPLSLIHVGEPLISMIIDTSASPLADKSDKHLTARLVKARLRQELTGNISVRVKPISRPGTWGVQGCGELQLTVLMGTTRREGFELTVGKPQVVAKIINEEVHEPIERLTIDIPEELVGMIIQLMGLRRGRMGQMINRNAGWVRMEFLVPTRGLIRSRTEFLTETRGIGTMNHVAEGYEP